MLSTQKTSKSTQLGNQHPQSTQDPNKGRYELYCKRFMLERTTFGKVIDRKCRGLCGKHHEIHREDVCPGVTVDSCPCVPKSACKKVHADGNEDVVISERTEPLKPVKSVEPVEHVEPIEPVQPIELPDFMPADCGQYRREDVEGDGNCLFRAWAKILLGDQNRHQEMRALVVEQMRKDPEMYLDHITSPRKRAGYIANMSQNKTWGDQPEISAFEDATGLPVQVWIVENNEKGIETGLRRVINSIPDVREIQAFYAQTERIHIAYINRNHYQVIHWTGRELTYPVTGDQRLFNMRRRIRGLGPVRAPESVPEPVESEATVKPEAIAKPVSVSEPVVSTKPVHLPTEDNGWEVVGRKGKGKGKGKDKAPVTPESKPVESKPVESKPVESKPVESKPVRVSKPSDEVLSQYCTTHRLEMTPKFKGQLKDGSLRPCKGRCGKHHGIHPCYVCTDGDSCTRDDCAFVHRKDIAPHCSMIMDIAKTSTIIAEMEATCSETVSHDAASVKTPGSIKPPVQAPATLQHDDGDNVSELSDEDGDGTSEGFDLDAGVEEGFDLDAEPVVSTVPVVTTEPTVTEEDDEEGFDLDAEPVETAPVVPTKPVVTAPVVPTVPTPKPSPFCSTMELLQRKRAEQAALLRSITQPAQSTVGSKPEALDSTPTPVSTPASKVEHTAPKPISFAAAAKSGISSSSSDPSTCAASTLPAVEEVVQEGAVQEGVDLDEEGVVQEGFDLDEEGVVEEGFDLDEHEARPLPPFAYIPNLHSITTEEDLYDQFSAIGCTGTRIVEMNGSCHGYVFFSDDKGGRTNLADAVSYSGEQAGVLGYHIEIKEGVADDLQLLNE